MEVPRRRHGAGLREVAATTFRDFVSTLRSVGTKREVEAWIDLTIAPPALGEPVPVLPCPRKGAQEMVRLPAKGRG